MQDRDAAWNIRQAVIAADHAGYRYTATLGAKTASAKKKDWCGSKSAAATPLRWRKASRLRKASSSPRSGQPAAEISAARRILAQQAQDFAAQHTGVDCEVLDDAAMEALGMGSLLAVARGSAQRHRA